MLSIRFYSHPGFGQLFSCALRSPVLKGPGACGAFLVLEDQVPARPSGFCNVNGLFEVNIGQAKQVSVSRGPRTVVYGSNGLHRIIDVRSEDPDPASAAILGLSSVPTIIIGAGWAFLPITLRFTEVSRFLAG